MNALDAITSKTITPLFEPIAPKEVRYIKLGRGGSWDRALAEGRLYWGDHQEAIEESLRGDWAAAKSHYMDRYNDKSKATSNLRELRDFFELDATTLWITFAGGAMWWAFSEPAEPIQGAVDPAEPTTLRRTIGPWRNTDRLGYPLNQTGLSTKLTQLASYRRSICGVKHADYAVRRINGEMEPHVPALLHHRSALIDATAHLVRDLDWRDFEILVDLLFSSAGWRRISEVGGSMKDIDLLLEQPITGERVSVQVKSTISQSVANTCVENFEAGEAADRFFLVFHTGVAVPPKTRGPRPLHYWNCHDVAERVVDAGLTNWLIARTG